VCYHGEPIPADVQNCYDLIMDVVEEDGPFDAVLGFSQGSAIGATVMLTEAAKNNGKQPFKMGVFLSTTMPFDFGSGVLQLKYDRRDGLSAMHYDADLRTPTAKSEDVDWRTDCRSKGVIDEFEARHPCVQDSESVEVDVLLRYHPTTHSQRLRVPTVHVIGRKDDYAEHGKNLYGMCDPRYATVVTHDGGHQLPRDVNTVAKVADSIIRAVELMRYQS